MDEYFLTKILLDLPKRSSAFSLADFSARGQVPKRISHFDTVQ
jgi:hypothetical protein